MFVHKQMGRSCEGWAGGCGKKRDFTRVDLGKHGTRKLVSLYMRPSSLPDCVFDIPWHESPSARSEDDFFIDKTSLFQTQR